MSTAKPQRTKRKPAKAVAPHKWEPSHPLVAAEWQSFQKGYRLRRTPGYVAPAPCPPEHVAFADLLAACNTVVGIIEDEDSALSFVYNENHVQRAAFKIVLRVVRAAIAKAKPS